MAPVPLRRVKLASSSWLHFSSVGVKSLASGSVEAYTLARSCYMYAVIPVRSLKAIDLLFPRAHSKGASRTFAFDIRL